MAVRALLKNDALASNQGLVLYDGTFVVGAAGAVQSFVGGRVKSVARTGVGTYLITFLDFGYPTLLAKSADAETTGTGAWAGPGAVVLGTSDAAPMTYTVFTYNAGGTLADLTANNISFGLTLKRSVVK